MRDTVFTGFIVALVASLAVAPVGCGGETASEGIPGTNSTNAGKAGEPGSSKELPVVVTPPPAGCTPDVVAGAYVKAKAVGDRKREAGCLVKAEQAWVFQRDMDLYLGHIEWGEWFQDDEAAWFQYTRTSDLLNRTVTISQELLMVREDGEWRITHRSNPARDRRGDTSVAAMAADADNLIELLRAGSRNEFSITAKGDVRNTPRPATTGKAFWIALCVGDGPDGPLTVDKRNAGHLTPEKAARILVSPADPGAMPRNELLERLRSLIDAGEGVAGLTPDEIDRMCSYLGPDSPAYFRAENNLVVGCTGTRNGASLFPNGLNVVKTLLEVQFITYRQGIDELGWPAETHTPPVGHRPLNHIERAVDRDD